MAGSDDKEGVRDEFLAEAQEIIESLSRDLLLLDQAQKDDQVDPDLVNQVFRGVHTLKGIAGMFGYHQLGAVAHALEDLLDDLRLGRVDLSQEVLDVLFEGVENFGRLLAETGKDEDAEEEVDLQAYARSIERVSAAKDDPEGDPLEVYELDPSVLSVLTEYEEHRLRTNVEQGVELYRMRVRFPLASIDTALEDLKKKAKSLAEIITYLPSMEAGEDDAIELDVLLASRASAKELEQSLAGDEEISVTPVKRRGEKTVLPPAPPPPSAPGAEPSAPAPEGRSRETSVPPAADAAARSSAPESSAPKSSAPGPSDDDDDAGSQEQSLKSVTQTVRVDIRKLDHLMNVVGELAIVRGAIGRIAERLRGQPEYRKLATDLHRVHRSFERQLDTLQDGILDVRMVPLGQVFDRLARIVRQVAREHEKEVRLVVTGSETEVDKLIVEDLSDPLMHIIRNSIDHGIESPKVRELAGKTPEGTLVLNAYQKGNHVVIEIEDDGAGMSDTRLIETALRKGLIAEESASELSSSEAINLIFMPGFSTRSAITDTSGRGVGMDVVKHNIAKLGGVIDVQSEQGTGTKFTITLPITLAIIRALLIEVRERVYAVPLTAVEEAIVLDPRAIRTVEGREVITLRGATLPICRLAKHFELDGGSAAAGDAKRFVVVVSLGHRRLGFVVDGLQGQQDIVIKALGKSLSNIRGFAGATDLGDQRVALVLDPPSLLEEVLDGAEASLTTGVER